MVARLAAALLVSAACTAPLSAQTSFPRVYGATGQPYGPTQAHYQYERQYGRPWHGYGGYTLYGGSTNVVVNGVPAWGGWAWGGWAGYGAPWVIGGPVIVSPFAPGLSFYSPGFWGGYAVYGYPGYYLPYPDYRLVQPNLNLQPFAPPLEDALWENAERWGPELPPAKPDPVTLPVAPSSNEAKLKSLRAVQDGDADLRNQQWLQAYMDYKRAVQAAPDNAQAYFRQGLALSAVQHFDSAVFSFKRALALDPTLPKSGEDLEAIFGPGSEIARNATLLKIADWVRQDVRDPDRLFLFGVWLHFSHDNRATEVFEAGYRLAGRGQHFLAFLKTNEKPPPAEPQPPQPTPPEPGPQLPPPPLPAQ